MPKRKPVEAAEPAPVVAEPKKKAARSTTAAKPKSTTSPVAHKHHAKKTVPDEIQPSPVIAISHEEIARLAYTYWEARGCQGSSPDQDWLRAESELLKLAQNR